MNKAIAFFNQIGKNKIEFKPEIKIKMTPHSPITYINDMVKIKSNEQDVYLITLSNRENVCMRKNVSTLSDIELSSITIRLYSMYESIQK